MQYAGQVELTCSKLADDLDGALVHLKHDWALAQGIALRCPLQAPAGQVLPGERMVQPAHAACKHALCCYRKEG